jgi:hypothetical protein
MEDVYWNDEAEEWRWDYEHGYERGKVEMVIRTR